MLLQELKPGERSQKCVIRVTKMPGWQALHFQYITKSVENRCNRYSDFAILYTAIKQAMKL